MSTTTSNVFFSCSHRQSSNKSTPFSLLRSQSPKRHPNLSVSFSIHGNDNIPGQVIPIEKKYPAFPSVLDINEIREILPHRFPFLLVDRVIEYNPGVSVVAIKDVTMNDDFFPGHFPERPIMPGVLMLEAMAQVGGIVMFKPDVGRESQEKFFFAGIDGARFRKPVTAGDTLVMRMSLMKHRKRMGVAKLEGKAYVGCDLVCEAEFILATGSTK